MSSPVSSGLRRKRPIILRWFGYCALAGVLLYGVGVFCFSFYFKYIRGFPDVRYRDIALPQRWERIDRTIGRHLIASAHEAFHRGEPQVGIHYLRAGLRKSPDHQDARRALAQIHLLSGEHSQAGSLLLDGLLHHADDARYVAGLLEYLFARQDDESAKAVCDDLLAGKYATSSTTRQLAAWGAATACYHRGRYDFATDYLVGHRLTATREGRLLLARIEWERGYPELALNALRALAAEFPGDEEIHLQLARYLHEHDHPDERRRLLLLLSVARPDLPYPRLSRLEEFSRAGETTRFEAECAVLLRDYSGNPSALLAVGDFAAGLGNIALAQRVKTLLGDDFLSAQTAELLVAETRLNAGDPAGASADLDTLLAPERQLAPELHTAALGLRAVSLFSLGRNATGQAALQEFMSRPGLRPANLQAVAQRLIGFGAVQAAQAALLRAVEIDPFNQAALTQLLQLEIQSGELDRLPKHLGQLLQMRKPARATLLAAQHVLGRDQLLFSPAHRQALLEIERHLAASP